MVNDHEVVIWVCDTGVGLNGNLKILPAGLSQGPKSRGPNVPWTSGPWPLGPSDLRCQGLKVWGPKVRGPMGQGLFSLFLELY